MPVIVVEDNAEHLITFTPPGSRFGFPEGPWPTPDGLHPWHNNGGWHGHGCLMIQRPGDHHAVWHFWQGDDREFACWYINLQADFVRTGIGYDTQDFELDLIVTPDHSWILKDDDVIDERVTEGRFTADLVAWIRSLGADLCDRVDRPDYWWDLSWASWAPDPTWVDATLPEGWDN